MSRPFSNGTEHEIWDREWCARCLHDHPFRSRGVGCGCPILRNALLLEDGWPPEWFDNGKPWPMHVTCIEFKPFGYRKPGPPVPKAPPPNQGDLFDPTIIPWTDDRIRA